MRPSWRQRAGDGLGSFQKMVAVCAPTHIFCALAPAARFSPYRGLCLGRDAVRLTGAERVREMVEDALLVALAAGLNGVFRADHHHIVASGGANSEAMGFVAAVREIVKSSVEGKAIERLRHLDR
jgi:hypothetical protein